MTRIIFTNKFKIFVSLLLVAVSVVIAMKSRGQSEKEKVEVLKSPTEVSVRKAGELKSSTYSLKYPGTIVGQQEVKIVALAGGVVNSLNFDLGDGVEAGKTLLTIDDQKGLLQIGDNDLRSAQVQQLELSMRQAKKLYDLAKDRYDSDKTDANKTAKEVAKLQYESAKVSLNNSLNAHNVTAPISGTITKRMVSFGDAVSPGQLLATISKTNSVKVQLFLSSEDIRKISVGSQAKIEQSEKQYEAKIINISPQADPSTGKFLVEIVPNKRSALLLGVMADVWIESSDKAVDGLLFLPLPVLNSTQTGTYIFIDQDGLAKKVQVAVMDISGEMAVVKADIPDEQQIVVEGNKLLQEGDRIKIR